MRRKEFIRRIGVGGLGLTLTACEKFDVSTYQNELSEDRQNTNAK